MKVCRKCNNEYKDAYSFCPKCGKPFDDSIKAPKIPGVPRTDGLRILSLIWNIILYIIGSIFILVFLFSIPEAPIGSIFGILFGLSLFQVFYKIVEDKTSISRVLLIIARFVLPFILLIATGLGLPTEPDKDNKQNIKIEEKKDNQTNTSQDNNTQKINNNENNTSETKKNEVKKTEDYTKAHIAFNKLCSKAGITPRDQSNQKGDYNLYAEANMNYNISVSGVLVSNEIIGINMTHYYDDGPIDKAFFLTVLEFNFKTVDKEQLSNWINSSIGTDAEILIGDYKFTTKNSTEKYVTLDIKNDKLK